MLDILLDFKNQFLLYQQYNEGSIFMLFQLMNLKGMKCYEIDAETLIIGRKKKHRLNGLTIIKSNNSCFVGELKDN